MSLAQDEPDTWNIIQDSIFTPNCISCHDHGLYFAEQSDLILAEDVAYEELINTVKRIENDKIEELKLSAINAQQLEADKEVISSVRNSIEAGITSKAAIIKFVNQETGITQRKISKVLDDRTGNIYQLGHRWSVETGLHNKNKYSLLKFESVTGPQKTE